MLAATAAIATTITTVVLKTVPMYRFSNHYYQFQISYDEDHVIAQPSFRYWHVTGRTTSIAGEAVMEQLRTSIAKAAQVCTFAKLPSWCSTTYADCLVKYKLIR